MIMLEEAETTCAVIGCQEKTMDGVPIKLPGFLKDKFNIPLCIDHINEVSRNLVRQTEEGNMNVK